MTAPVRRQDLISRKAASAQLGIHGNTFDRWAKRKNLTRYRIVGDTQVFFHRAEIAEKWNEIEIVEESA